ncbi:LpqB family beta-propeller domain-containing protein [Microbacterium ulmi]|uniref:GerMN domain-containing protein n=1 Tax=Microbacterium ulmi TaxID=179095 RepID=A0A7Y2M2S6_9MICO|nr:LpqB family beta-propeller domain-containing protein [Microbacterium ulmi]NII70398.1 hypothetical protein [Microbacterium ulmi]NNH05445.1 hypothetical protein [Microbacterium ulmi]
MRRGRGILSALAAVVAVVALAGCAGLDTSGPVNMGHADDGQNAQLPDIAFRPDSPQTGATPDQIVAGFLRAGSGPSGGWSVAQEFLAPEFRTTWKPQAGVTIDIAGDRLPVVHEDGSVTVTLTPVATVDATGAYEPSELGSTEIAFALEQIDGEWRITQAPDGLVLDRDQFTNVFRRYSLMYFDPSWQFLVPDVRWFTSTGVAKQIVDALLDGRPSPWLADSVVTAFPEGTTLAGRSVPAPDGVAQVDLTAEALTAEGDAFDRMQTQLVESLRGAGVSAVQMYVGAAQLDATPIETRSTRVGTLPLVRTEGGFGFLAGDELSPIPGLSKAIEELPVAAVQVSRDQDFAGVRLADGTVVRVEADGSSLPLDARAGLVDPTVDPQGFVWTVPRGAPGGVAAYARDGVRIAVADAWPGASQIAGIAVSRDGTRIAAVVTTGGRTAVWISGIVRDADGVPQRLAGDSLTLSFAPGVGAGIAWIDDVSLGILSRDGDSSVVVEQAVGGQAVETAAPASAASIAGGTASSPARLRTADGALLIQRGTNWQQTASGIALLATQ